MPNTKSAAKALRQSRKRALRNKRAKDNIAYLKRQIRKALTGNDKTKAQEWFLKLQKSVDKAVQHGILKKNTGSRIKSRWSKRIFSSLKSKSPQKKQ